MVFTRKTRHRYIAVAAGDEKRRNHRALSTKETPRGAARLELATWVIRGCAPKSSAPSASSLDHLTKYRLPTRPRNLQVKNTNICT